MAVVVEREAAVGEADHPVGMGVLAGQQAGAAPRAGRGGAEGLAEDDALLGQTLDVRRPDGVAVGPDPPARVVGVDVEDVRKIPQFLPLCAVLTAARSLYRPTHSSERSSACCFILGCSTANFSGTGRPKPSSSRST